MPREHRSIKLDGPVPRVDRVVQALTGASRAAVRAMFAEGCVLVDGTPCREPGSRAGAGARIDVHFDPGRRYREAAAVRPGQPGVVWEDRHLVVVEKQAGVLTVPTLRGERDTLVHRVARYFSRGRTPQRAFVVHRLDRDTSGLLVFARTDALAQALKRQFASHKPEREYAAIVAGRVGPDSGTFRSYLATDEDLDEVSSEDPGGGRLAITHFEVVERLRDATFVRVRLETGRRNQVRVHFADAGHPVLGDTRYSRERARHPAWRHPRLALHARTLGFEHPITRREVRVTTDLPPEIQEFLEATRQRGG